MYIKVLVQKRTYIQKLNEIDDLQFRYRRCTRYTLHSGKVFDKCIELNLNLFYFFVVVANKIIAFSKWLII